MYAFNMAKIIGLKVVEVSFFSMDRKDIINVKCLDTDSGYFRNFTEDEFGRDVFRTKAEALEFLTGILGHRSEGKE